MQPMGQHSPSCVSMWCVIQTARDVRKPASRREDSWAVLQPSLGSPRERKISLKFQLNILPALPVLFILVSTSSGLGKYQRLNYPSVCDLFSINGTLCRAPAWRIIRYAFWRKQRSAQNKMEANSRNNQGAMFKKIWCFRFKNSLNGGYFHLRSTFVFFWDCTLINGR